ncbi:hypothetical protein ABGB07_05630 [Micromonosporaceae bacterium B7E4]
MRAESLVRHGVAVLRCLVAAVPVARQVNRDCRELAAAFEAVVAPSLVRAGLPEGLHDRLLGWGVSGGMLVRGYALLVNRPPRPDLEILAGVFTRLYDDLLDEFEDPTIGQRIGRLFAGHTFVARTPLEEVLHETFDALRQRVPRERAALPYRALGLLHRRQLRSLRQVGGGLDPAEIRDLTLAKGGLGMVVLGGLVTPDPGRSGIALLMALGGFLQLVDDFQDVDVDRRHGVHTCATAGVLPFRDLCAALRAVETHLGPDYHPGRRRRFLTNLYFWLYVAGVGRLLPHRPARSGPLPRRLPLRTLIVPAEVIR